MAEYQTFWDDFFTVFGIRRRMVAIYQKKVEKLGEKRGFIDLFWPGVLIVEHKSSGQSLDAAFTQATDYFSGLKEEEHPQYVIVSDYQTIRLYDLEGTNGVTQHDFPLKELHKHVRLFGFIAGYRTVKNLRTEDPINVKAATAVGKLHDALRDSGYKGHQLEVFLTRLVFCFFADDAGIFERDSLINYIELKTKVDGSDLGPQLGLIFQTLNTPESDRQTSLDEDVAGLQYINGGLFAERLSLPSFTSTMRKTLIDCMVFDWQNVSPAIFGSMFQSVMDERQRHDLGAHYTSEKNILKVINGLFLDELRQELESAKNNKPKLTALWDKIAKMKLFDPACGCGNFLVVAYRELRLLEMDIIQRLYQKDIDGGQESFFTTQELSKLDVDMMYGIEIEEFPQLIANLALWLTDHQMNLKFSELVGQARLRLPLTHAPTIVPGNALQLDWKKIVAPEKLTHILGNPPFISKSDRSPEQKADMELVFGKLKGAGELDYVTAWYKKAADYIEGTSIPVAFVSTNSITQGEQVGILWPELWMSGVSIFFAHRTFKWSNEATGRAAVYCVIIGFSAGQYAQKYIFDYESPDGEAHVVKAEKINPYLIDADSVTISARRTPLSAVPMASFGNMPNDGGHLLLTQGKKEELLIEEPQAEKYIQNFISAREFFEGEHRYCLWLKGIEPTDLRNLPLVKKHVEAVFEYRQASVRAATKKLAEVPALFAEIRQPTSQYILIPRHSSERRKYVPFGYLDAKDIVADSCIAVADATLYYFGVLQSNMHMTWMRQVCGRIKSDYRYSIELVYNNFPWPEDVSVQQKTTIEQAAQEILEVRKNYPKSTLADLYDPTTMPKDLLDAHHALDIAVDLAYGKKSFANDLERLEFLFELYRQAMERKV